MDNTVKQFSPNYKGNKYLYVDELEGNTLYEALIITGLVVWFEALLIENYILRITQMFYGFIVVLSCRCYYGYL